jgi:hypothetical protein
VVTVRIPYDPSAQAADASARLLRLQNEFYARLSEETVNYLRNLGGVLAPAAPGTVLLPDPGAELTATAAPGETVALAVEVVNEQVVHCVVTPTLSTLVDRTGVTWFPAARAVPPYLAVPPGQVERAALEIAVPDELPAGDYRGVLLLHGLPHGLPVTITVRLAEPVTPRKAAAGKATAGKATPRKATSHKAAPRKAAPRKATPRKSTTSRRSTR